MGRLSSSVCDMALVSTEPVDSSQATQHLLPQAKAHRESGKSASFGADERAMTSQHVIASSIRGSGSGIHSSSSVLGVDAPPNPPPSDLFSFINFQKHLNLPSVKDLPIQSCLSRNSGVLASVLSCAFHNQVSSNWRGCQTRPSISKKEIKAKTPLPVLPSFSSKHTTSNPSLLLRSNHHQFIWRSQLLACYDCSFPP